MSAKINTQTSDLSFVAFVDDGSLIKLIIITISIIIRRCYRHYQKLYKNIEIALWEVQRGVKPCRNSQCYSRDLTHDDIMCCVHCYCYVNLVDMCNLYEY